MPPTDWGQACSTWAVAAEVVVDCFGFFAEPGSPDPGNAAGQFTEGGSVTIDVGSLTIALDVADASGGYAFGDRAAFDLGPMTRLWVLPPSPVRDPAGPGDGPMTDPIPWPGDYDAWLAGLDATVGIDESVELGGRAFRHVVLTAASTEPLPIIENPAADTGTINVPADGPLHLWVGEIDGQTIVATVAVGIPDAEQLFVEMATDILANLRIT